MDKADATSVEQPVPTEPLPSSAALPGVQTTEGQAPPADAPAAPPEGVNAAAAEPAADEGQSAVQPAPGAVKRKTPVYGVWFTTRTRQRLVAKEGTAILRAYHAVRHRSGSFVAIEATEVREEVPVPTAPESVAVPQAPERAAPVLQVPVPPAPVGAAGDVPASLADERRRSRRHDSRRVQPPGPSRSRRLWDLLMAIILITALIATLFLISR